MSIMLPISISFLIVWTLVLVTIYSLGIPLGPGIYPHLGM